MAQMSVDSLLKEPKVYVSDIDTFLAYAIMKREVTFFEEKVDFQELEEGLEEIQEELSDRLSTIAKKQEVILLRKAKKIIEGKLLADIPKLQVAYVGDFKNILRDYMIKLHLDSKVEALRELKRGGINIQIVTKFQLWQPWQPIPPKEAMDFFNKKVLAKIIYDDRTKKLINLATGKELYYYDKRAFVVAGVERENILKQIQNILLDAIKGDMGYKPVENAIRDVFKGYIDTKEKIGDRVLTRNRIETIVRTNMTEAMNYGRWSVMNDPDITQFVPYIQWSSIMDDRTTDYCFLAGTRILMENGSERNIEDVWIGERVIAGNGEVKQVENVFKRPVNEYLNFVVGDNIIRVTKEHPIWDGTKFKGAGEWNVGEKTTYIKVPELRESICREPLPFAKVLCNEVLSCCSNQGQVGSKKMSAVRQDVLCKKMLRKEGAIQVLFNRMPSYLRKKGNVRNFVSKNVSKMWKGIQDKTNRSLTEQEQKVLLKGVPKRRKSLRYLFSLWGNCKEKVWTTKAFVLFKNLLCKIQSTFNVRNGDRRSVKGFWSRLYQRVSSGEFYDRLLLATDEDSIRSGWGILAPWEQERSKEEQRKSNSGSRLQFNSDTREGSQKRPLFDSSKKVNILPYLEEQSVTKIEVVNNPAVVYNLQIKDNPTYFANGILVHNCRAMDRKIFRKDDPNFRLPPAHFNCRSIVVPITIYDLERERVTVSSMPKVEAKSKVKRTVGFTRT